MPVTMQDDLSNICHIITETLEVEKIYLFGSYAYGTPNADSDYDLCVVIPDGTMRPVDAMKRIRRALFSVQTVPLDVIVYQASTFLQRQGMYTMERKIAREGVLLYARTGGNQRMA